MKRFVLILLGLSIVSISYCQKTKSIELFLGLSQGMTYSLIDFNPNERMLVLPGYYGGLNLTYKSQPVVGVKLELNYALKGWKSDLDSSQSYTRTLSYFEIPFTTHIILGNKNSLFLIDIGPYAGYLYSESEKMHIINEEKDYFDQKVNRAFDFGYCIKFSYQYKTCIGRIGLEAGYSNSLTNIFIPSSEFEYYSSRNQVFSIRFIYSIKIV